MKMKEVPGYFKIDQDGGGTAVEEITAEEYAERYAVMVMEHALENRKAVPFPEGNTVNRIIEVFIRNRIPVESVKKIVVSQKLLASLVMYAGHEVSRSPEGQIWIFDGIIPIEISDEIEDFEIIRKDK